MLIELIDSILLIIHVDFQDISHPFPLLIGFGLILAIVFGYSKPGTTRSLVVLWIYGIGAFVAIGLIDLGWGRSLGAGPRADGAAIAIAVDWIILLAVALGWSVGVFCWFGIQVRLRDKDRLKRQMSGTNQ